MKSSAYTIPIELPVNGILLLYNTRSGALVEFPLSRKADIEATLAHPSGAPPAAPPPIRTPVVPTPVAPTPITPTPITPPKPIP